jgi:uncharacterized membrane-anchored protein
MQALQELFSSDAGLASLAVIAFTLGMGAFFLRYFIHHMHVDEARERARLQAMASAGEPVSDPAQAGR